VVDLLYGIEDSSHRVVARRVIFLPSLKRIQEFVKEQEIICGAQLSDDIILHFTPLFRQTQDKDNENTWLKFPLSLPLTHSLSLSSFFYIPSNPPTLLDAS